MNETVHIVCEIQFYRDIEFLKGHRASYYIEDISMPGEIVAFQNMNSNNAVMIEVNLIEPDTFFQQAITGQEISIKLGPTLIGKGIICHLNLSSRA